MSFKINKYSNFVVDKINELPRKQHESTTWYMKVHPTARHSHTLNINVSSGWNRACGPAILVQHSNQLSYNCQAGVHVQYVYLGTVVLRYR
jgi:hypothetical protein